ncbi:hypothetical protein GYMLUDRAFT_35119 [Collybiopsis luxurians FD-317 M1]|nr:hypothetical protein GYMLUDRAFT_35119 [Collybiopsis luxurians FD-317 M1]
MVSSVPFDILAAPQVEIQRIFDQHIQSQSSEEFSVIVSNHFEQVFGTDDRLDLIPHLDQSHLNYEGNSSSSSSPLKLVQFRAMIQDTSASPELYLSHLGGGKYGGWGANEAMNGSVDYSNLRECAKYWVVSVPGQSPWSGKDRLKEVSEPQTSRRNAHKFPLPSTSHIGVQATVYSPNVDLKSTEVITFVGLFESEHETLHVLFHLPEKTVPKPYRFYPLGAQKTQGAEGTIRTLRSELISWIADEALAGDADAAEWVLLSVISRVQSRNPPILPASLTLSRFPPPTRTQVTSASGSAFDSSDTSSRNTPALYHVLSLLIPIITRIPLSLPLLNEGAFVPESKPRTRLDHADDEEDELYSGILQLAPTTVCLITDSGVTEGQINERGVRNLQALQEVIRNQTLEYIFPYSGFRFETDIGCIVCTEGRKSAMAETHITIPLKPPSSLSASDLQSRLYKSSAEINHPFAEKIEAWRKLIGGAMSKQSSSTDPASSSSAVPVGGIGVSDAAAVLIQDEFVKERQDAAKEKKESENRAEPGKGITTPDDLIHRMLMAKLLALSLHEPEVSTAIWEQMKNLEWRRLERISA